MVRLQLYYIHYQWSTCLCRRIHCGGQKKFFIRVSFVYFGVDCQYRAEPSDFCIHFSTPESPWIRVPSQYEFDFVIVFTFFFYLPVSCTFYPWTAHSNEPYTDRTIPHAVKKINNIHENTSGCAWLTWKKKKLTKKWYLRWFTSENITSL